ncbi:hypothetical protein BJY16_007568 [Actinoplanes octamycinicus]|uniref:Uncharacterized protein n=1 Tax=Actinoplanes octamycinicus TaxID=135948 RepID=A0A7W7MBG6_9ACTN|nr:hypothetical protein [Actinoplanes octamycinicus]MBB4744109.1 hypothetical protein [Actinoplanes octamycinicus]GIE56934.1 hypothetical protein Aoc01nite_23360 [Actinoplanes octamycinicus]
MFDFEEEPASPSQPPQGRLAALSRTFLMMVGLAAAAMVAVGGLLFWALQTFQN